MTKKNSLSVYKSNHEKNWYYQKDNFDNWKALRAIDEIEDFINANYPDVIKAIDLINLTHKQSQFLINHADNPESVLGQLATMPLSVQQKRLFYAMLLKWHGGYPVLFTPDEAIRNILKSIETDFLQQCEGQDLPEKAFAQIDKRLGARIVGELTRPPTKIGHDIYDRHFKIIRTLIDFGDLPIQIVKVGIVGKFAQEDAFNKTDYSLWEAQLVSYLKQINASKYALTYLKKAIEYGKLVLQFHVSYECNHPNGCDTCYSWQRRVEITEQILNKIEEEIQEPVYTKGKDPEITTARQVLAMHYLFEYCQVKNVDNTAKARFIQFMTGKEIGAKSISNTSIYKRVNKPFSSDDKTLNSDLQYVRKYFEELGLNEIAKMITNEISKSGK